MPNDLPWSAVLEAIRVALAAEHDPGSESALAVEILLDALECDAAASELAPYANDRALRDARASIRDCPYCKTRGLATLESDCPACRAHGLALEGLERAIVLDLSIAVARAHALDFPT